LKLLFLEPHNAGLKFQHNGSLSSRLGPGKAEQSSTTKKCTLDKADVSIQQKVELNFNLHFCNIYWRSDQRTSSSALQSFSLPPRIYTPIPDFSKYLTFQSLLVSNYRVCRFPLPPNPSNYPPLFNIPIPSSIKLSSLSHSPPAIPHTIHHYLTFQSLLVLNYRVWGLSPPPIPHTIHHYLTFQSL
jgi:hypothetical protein